MGAFNSCLGVDQSLAGDPRFLNDSQRLGALLNGNMRLDSNHPAARAAAVAASAAAANNRVPMSPNHQHHSNPHNINRHFGKQLNNYPKMTPIPDRASHPSSHSHQATRSLQGRSRINVMRFQTAAFKFYGSKSGSLIHRLFKKSKLSKSSKNNSLQKPKNHQLLSPNQYLQTSNSNNNQTSYPMKSSSNQSNVPTNNVNSTNAKLVDIDDHSFDQSFSNTTSQQQLLNNPSLRQQQLLIGNQQVSTCNIDNSIRLPTNCDNIPMIDHQPQQRAQQHQSFTGRQPTLLIARFDYDPVSHEDLPLRKGDLLIGHTLKNDGHWWLAESKATGKTGYVPGNYVIEKGSLEAEPWYVGKIGRLEAERRLKGSGNTNGSFLIRDADNNQNRFSLSLRHKDEVKHYRIRSAGGRFFISNKILFSSLQEFVMHYSRNSDGLCVELRQPCIMLDIHKPTIQGLSHDLCDKWEIDRSELKRGAELGHGQFGQVFEGIWKNKIRVAIKTLKRDSMDPQEFITEAQIMKNLRHEKLVQLFAVCTREEPIYIVTELMENGCLLSYLQKNRQKLDLRTLIYIGCQIAEGMAYLEENNYLHRDLAARNVLVKSDNIVKIADFGLARLIKETEYEARPFSKCPMKWTSPESITFSRYSSKSDVWSFGIVLYEIITFGNIPYPGMSNSEMLQKVEQGYRMPIEIMPNCPPKLYDIMMQCWNKEPSRRPTFASLLHSLDNFFN